jgi:glycosyltransferase involved in cell wall biosynthesis
VRLVMFIHSLESGGAERVVANFANHWTEKGWDVTVVTLESDAADFYGLNPGVARIALNRAGESSNVVVGLWQNVQRIKALRQVLEKVRPDIALSLMSNANVLLALAARGMRNMQAIGSERIYPPRLPLGSIWEVLRRHSYSQLSAVVALTQECADWVRQHTNARRIPVIPNAASWPLTRRVPHLSPADHCLPGRKLLLAVGRLCNQKNVETLIDVFAKLAPRHPDWDLVILGEGPLHQVLQARVQSARLEDRISMPGRAGNVGDWYEQADLYVLTSHFEGFPNTLAEAMAHGVPAVSFDCDTGPRDIIRHGIDGLLVAAGDTAGLELALDKAMGDGSLRQALASNAIQARERFSMEKVARMWEELFLDCIASGAGKDEPVRRSDHFFSADNQKGKI